MISWLNEPGARYYIWYEYIEVHSPMIKYIKDLKSVHADTWLSLGRNEPYCKHSGEEYRSIPQATSLVRDQFHKQQA